MSIFNSGNDARLTLDHFFFGEQHDFFVPGPAVTRPVFNRWIFQVHLSLTTEQWDDGELEGWLFSRLGPTALTTCASTLQKGQPFFFVEKNVGS